jgi:membrane fusion protein (multidrug efflux system)
VPVEIARAELGSAARYVAATGTIEPIRTVGINAQLTGALLRVLVEEGDVVQAGALLAQVDSRELEAQMTSAAAQLEVARKAAERSQTLFDARANTQADYDRDQAAYAASRATHDQLKMRLAYASIRAPIAGVILDKRVEAGDIVTGQTRLFTIGDVSTLVVRVPISELDVTGLTEGDAVEVTADALPGRTLTGRVRRVFPSADTLSRLVPVEVSLTAASAKAVRPGFLARVNLRLDPRSNVLLIPANALLEDPSGSIVYIVEAGKAARRRVVRGPSYQGRVEIVEGLVPGDSVIVAGNTMVRDGGPIRIVMPSTDAPNALAGPDSGSLGAAR